MSTTIEIGNVADMDFGQDSQTFFYSRNVNGDSEIVKVINANSSLISLILKTIDKSSAHKLLFKNNKLIVLSSKNTGNSGEMFVLDPDTGGEQPKKVTVTG